MKTAGGWKRLDPSGHGIQRTAAAVVKEKLYFGATDILAMYCTNFPSHLRHSILAFAVRIGATKRGSGLADQTTLPKSLAR
jgi:hypothetical protein